MNTLIKEQAYIRMSAPNLSGSLDYKQMVEIFEKINHILVEEGVENQMKLVFLKNKISETGAKFDNSEQLRLQRRFSQALRINITKSLLSSPYRELSARISDSNLLQWFCQFDHPQVLKLPSKSTLNNLAHSIPHEMVRGFHNILMKAVHEGMDSLDEEIDFSSIYADSTCIKLNIHHPIDWVLIRDSVKSIMRTIKTIRKHGLKHRMSPPDNFIKKVNQLSIEMTMTKSQRKQESKKKRKDVLRELKSLLRTVEKHGHRYLKIIQYSWEKSSLSKKQAERLSMNLVNILDQVDDVIFQAHERIIGERKVKNKDKVLSLYEKHAQVYTRGKAGAEVEFGLQLFVAETEQGLLIDWDLRDGKPKNDSKFVKPCVERIKKNGITPKEFTGDRGFVSKHADSYLRDNKIKNQIYPRNVSKARRKKSQPRFLEASNRRSQTEGRIGIFKNNFLGGKLKSKGYQNQNTQVAWAILAHNLWILARMPIEFKKDKLIA